MTKCSARNEESNVKDIGIFLHKNTFCQQQKGTPNAAIDLWRQCMTWKIGHFNYDMCLINEGRLWFESWTVGYIWMFPEIGVPPHHPF